MDDTLNDHNYLTPRRISYGNANAQHPEIWSNLAANDVDEGISKESNSILFSSNAILFDPLNSTTAGKCGNENRARKFSLLYQSIYPWKSVQAPGNILNFLSRFEFV
jgi:hypothetical protein